MPKKVLREVGRCIYCPQPAIGDEHVIPESLGGEWILKRASCRACETITSVFELLVARNTFIVARSVLGLRKKKRRKKSPESLALSVVREGEDLPSEISIPHGEMAATAILPILAPPAHLGGPERSDGVLIEGLVEVQIGRRSLEDIAAHRGLKKIVTSVSYDGLAFERMLAKIGYGFAVGEFGLDSFQEVFVLPHILGQRQDIGRWVGRSLEECPLDGRPLHQVSIGTRGREVHARIRLFASDHAPVYHVCVGSLSKSFDSSAPG